MSELYIITLRCQGRQRRLFLDGPVGASSQLQELLSQADTANYTDLAELFADTVERLAPAGFVRVAH